MSSVEVFRSKRREPVIGLNLASLFNRKGVKGEVGIEIEVEGNKFKKDNLPAPWSYHHDGSLRGHDNAEYVLRSPVMFKDVPKAIETLWGMFEEYGSVLDVSNRTSVHVHLNVQKFHLNRLTCFISLFLSVEELLTQWCGDHRVGNLFCLRAKDATAIVHRLKKFIQGNGHYELSDGLHYAGLNANAITKFGSLEIRTLRGCTDPQTIINWIEILERIYRVSADFSDPRQIPGILSSDGTAYYLDLVFGDKKQMILDDIGYNNQQVRDALYTGIRLAQDLCYCRDWSEYKAVSAKDDPFGRDMKKVAQQLAGLEAAYQSLSISAGGPLTTIQPLTMNPAGEQGIYQGNFNMNDFYPVPIDPESF